MTKFTRLILFILLTGGLRLEAQEAGATPLLNSEEAAESSIPGGWIAAELRANAALQAGFARTAASIYREILADRTIPADARARIQLNEVTALLDAGDLPAASKGLQEYGGARNAEYQLRAGLLAMNARRIAAAKAALAAGKAGELSAADRGWWYMLEAMVADAENDREHRNQAYEEAAKASVSDVQRARFALIQEQARLHSGQLNEAQLKTLRDNMEKFQGTRTGYDALRTYAAALAGLGRSSEAQTLLQRQLAVMPVSERNVADQLRLVLGLISGEGSVAGQQAFRQLLRDGQKPETQRLALQLLVHGAQTPAEREQLRRDLSALIGAPGQHPIIEDLLLARAQTALADKLYAPADEDARALLDRYPDSSLKTAAMDVRLSVAWDLKRYRTAADVIGKLREIMPEGRERSELGVLLADAFFHAEDYKNAADAYSAALREPPAVVPAGQLIFQRVLSDLRANQLDSAIRQLDEATKSPAFDPVNRWQAEWNVTKEMQVEGRTPQAYERVNRLLEGGAEGVPDDLRIRLMWLRAKLSYDNSQPDLTLQQTDVLLEQLKAGAKVGDALRSEVTATTELLRAQALFKLDREQEGFAMLDRLRADFRGTKAAEYSYLVQADHLTQKGDMAGAQGELLKFVDDAAYKNSEYAPLALYEAAVNLERQGLERQLQEAYALLERLNKSYPQDDLVFYSRLKQGDLLRNLNDFPAARQIYEFLINNYSQHPDVLQAQLALADTLFAQGANVVNLESAATIFERLRDLASAPVDLRAEAGAMWGFALLRRSQAVTSPAERDRQIAKAQDVLWSVVNTFVLDPALSAKLGATGRFWVSRSLLELGQIHENLGHLDEAQRMYQLIVDAKLGGIAQARDKLARYRAAPEAKP